MRKGPSVKYARQCLEKSGISLVQEDNNLFASLAQERDLVINISNGTLSISVAIADGEESDVWFRIQTKCESRKTFIHIFDTMFQELLCAVQNFIEIRNNSRIGAQKVFS